jgi:hypothetical protein
MDEFDDIPADVAAALARQDEALALLARLRAAEPYARPLLDTTGEKRREFRRWPLPEGVSVEFHDGETWQKVRCADMGIGGARLHWPKGIAAPVPARLKTPAAPAVLTLVDIMWRDAKSDLAGVRFEFQDEEERDAWAGGLIDALLARHAVS